MMDLIRKAPVLAWSELNIELKRAYYLAESMANILSGS